MPDVGLPPRTRQYVDSLPRGLESYPECRVKASMACALLDDPPPALSLSKLPAPLRALVEPAPLASAWLPEAQSIALMIAVRELAFSDDAGYLQWAHEVLGDLFSGPLYRMIFALMSPDRLARGGSKRWQAMHQGTSRELVDLGANGHLGRICYPRNLYCRLFIELNVQAFSAVYSLSRARDPAVRVVNWTPTESVLEVVYDQALPRTG